MKNVIRLLACGVAAVALVAGPGIAQAGSGKAGQGHAAKAQRAAKAKKAVKRLRLTGFVLRQAAKFLDMKPGALARELKGHSLTQVAEAHGKSADELEAAIVAAFKAKLDARVAAQKTTQEKADKALARFEQRLSRLMDRVFQGHPAASLGKLMRTGLLKAAADYLGLTKQQLRQQLPGHSLAQLAEATPGKSVQGLEDALVAAVKTKLDKLVARGLRQERADKMLARFQNNVDELVAKVWPAAQS
jgi:hypothetical protein